MNYTDLFEFFHTNRPTLYEVLHPGLIFFLYVSLVFTAAGYLKKERRWATGYTRKLFHFVIFFSAAALQYFFDLRILCLFGLITSFLIFYALIRGASHPWYEALAREKDAPHRSYYIIVPYFATLIGGIVNNSWIPEAAITGYLVTGIGDAIGEPVGARWGLHQYRVPNFRKIKTVRSLEGSAAVFLASLLVLCILAGAILPSFTPTLLLKLVLIASTCTLVEAVSPHGWDNLTLQLVPAGLWHGLLL